MTRPPPVLHPEQVDAALLDDIRDASNTYWNNYTYTRAFDGFVNDRASAAVLASLSRGKCSGTAALQCMRDGFLGQWGSTRTLTRTNCPAIGTAIKRSALHIAQLEVGVRIDDLTNNQIDLIVESFETLHECVGVGATIASKLLAAIRPAAIVMWDMPIAAAYGFAHSPAGYWRFLQLVREFAVHLRRISFCGELESYLKPKQRQWKAPLAKLIDEWHWIRITREHEYAAQGADSEHMVRVGAGN